MRVQTFIVECGVCQQPWEVPRSLSFAPGLPILSWAEYNSAADDGHPLQHFSGETFQ